MHYSQGGLSVICARNTCDLCPVDFFAFCLHFDTFYKKHSHCIKVHSIHSVMCTFDFIQAHSNTFNDVCIAFLLHCCALTCIGTHLYTFNPICICMHSCSTTFQYIPSAFFERHIRVHVHFQCIRLTCCILLQCNAYHKSAFCCIQEL